MTTKLKTLRRGSRLGKYRIEGKLGEGAFASVYRVLDTLEGIRLALKIPHLETLDERAEDDIRREIRIAARLQHPRILPLKSADVIEGRLVLAYPLGERSLAERLRSRLALATAIDFAEQILEAVAFAHEQRVIHCDIKPENLILVDGELMLADFGIAKVAVRTIRASGSGTIGYCAPEQAMGQPSFRSDVFSTGLVLYRMLSGRLPEWPFEWPPPGLSRLKGQVHPDAVALLQRAIQVDPKRRFASATAMLAAFRKLKTRALMRAPSRRAVAAAQPATSHWKSVRWRQFQRRFGKALETRFACRRCRGPVSEAMTHCPWCGANRKRHDGGTRLPRSCPRCHRGMKADWRYCPWCYGPGFDSEGARRYTDKKYLGRCSNPHCKDKRLMAFMRYCPWCRRKVKRRWRIEDSGDACSACRWGVIKEFWSYCPWCGKRMSG